MKMSSAFSGPVRVGPDPEGRVPVSPPGPLPSALSRPVFPGIFCSSRLSEMAPCSPPSERLRSDRSCGKTGASRGPKPGTRQLRVGVDVWLHPVCDTGGSRSRRILSSYECAERGRTSEPEESNTGQSPDLDGQAWGTARPGEALGATCEAGQAPARGVRAPGPAWAQAQHLPHKRAHEAEEPSLPGPRAHRWAPAPTEESPRPQRSPPALAPTEGPPRREECPGPQRSPAPTGGPRRGVARRPSGPPAALSRPENPVRYPGPGRAPGSPAPNSYGEPAAAPLQLRYPPCGDAASGPCDACTRTCSEDATTRPPPPRRPQFRGGARERAPALRRKSRPHPRRRHRIGCRAGARTRAGRAWREPRDRRAERPCTGLRGPCASPGWGPRRGRCAPSGRALRRLAHAKVRFLELLA